MIGVVESLETEELNRAEQQLRRTFGELDAEEFYKEEDKWFVRPDEIYEASKILEFFNKRLGTDVQITLPFTTVLIKNFTFLAIFALVFWVLKHLR
jgi:hypothetical protein